MLPLYYEDGDVPSIESSITHWCVTPEAKGLSTEVFSIHRHRTHKNTPTYTYAYEETYTHIYTYEETYTYAYEETYTHIYAYEQTSHTINHA